jgi:hypothetical protein
MFRSQTRLIGARDRGELAALLAREPGYSVFLGNNLEMFGLKNDAVRFWGVFTRGRISGAVMVVERRLALYAPPDGDLAALGRLASDLNPEFVMGRADLVEGVTVRRAGQGDIHTLTQLYTGAEGFEQMAAEQVARTIRGRIISLRTYLAQVEGQAVAGASSSAETRAAAMVGGVWTAPAWRSRGLSTAVVAALSGELLREERVPYLFYRVDNVPAERVYARIGYRPVGRWMVVYFDRRDSA